MARRFTPAVRQNAFVRALVYGVPGSGKSRGCLQLAEALAEGQPVALIDAEPEAPAHYYADLVAFDRASVIKPTTDEYVALLSEAARDGYAVLVIDGLTQHWEVMQEWHDELAQQPKANAFAAWGPIGEDCERLLRQLLNYPGHVLVTAQGKQRYTQEGKKVLDRGLEPVCRPRDTFRFDHLIGIEPDHSVRVHKSRCPQLDGTDWACLWERLPQVLLAWCQAGSAVVGRELVEAFHRAERERDEALYRQTHAQAKALDEAGELIGVARSAVLRARDTAKAALNGKLGTHGAAQAAERARHDEPMLRRLAGLFGAVTQADDLDLAAERFDVAKTAWTQATEEGALRADGSAGATLADLEATARRHLERLRNGEGVPA